MLPVAAMRDAYVAVLININKLLMSVSCAIVVEHYTFTETKYQICTKELSANDAVSHVCFNSDFRNGYANTFKINPTKPLRRHILKSYVQLCNFYKTWKPIALP